MFVHNVVNKKFLIEFKSETLLQPMIVLAESKDCALKKLTEYQRESVKSIVEA